MENRWIDAKVGFLNVWTNYGFETAGKCIFH